MNKVVSFVSFFIKYPLRYKAYLTSLYLSQFKFPFAKNLSSSVPKYFININHYLHELSNSILKDFKIFKGEVLLCSKVNGKKINAYARNQSSDFMVYEQMFVSNSYETLIHLMQSHKIVPKVVFDCGSNVGYASLFLSLYFDNLKFYCIEPDINNGLQIEKNFKVNGINHYKIYIKGLWSHTTTLYLNTSFRDGKNWSFNTGKKLTDTPLESISLNEIVQENNIKHIDLLKIDIEGSEKDVFENDISDYSWLKITKVLVVEIHDEFNCRENILRILQQYNFKFYEHGELTYGINKSYL